MENPISSPNTAILPILNVDVIDPPKNFKKNTLFLGCETPPFVYITGAIIWGLYYIFAMIYGIILPWYSFSDFKAILILLTFSLFAIIFSWCYILTLFTNAGRVPENFKKEFSGKKGEENRYNYCTHCQLYKPVRTHHCSRCKECHIFMDHHCLWLNNCIGHKNYKYFYCTLFYCFLADLYISGIITWRWVSGPIKEDIQTFILGFLSLLVLIQVLIVGYLFMFHTYFVLTDMTTLDWFCCRGKGPNHSFNYGILENIKIRLGKNPILWLIPIPTSSYHDGVSFTPTNPPQESFSERDPFIQSSENDLEHSKDF